MRIVRFVYFVLWCDVKHIRFCLIVQHTSDFWQYIRRYVTLLLLGWIMTSRIAGRSEPATSDKRNREVVGCVTGLGADKADGWIHRMSSTVVCCMFPERHEAEWCCRWSRFSTMSSPTNSPPSMYQFEMPLINTLTMRAETVIRNCITWGIVN